MKLSNEIKFTLCILTLTTSVCQLIEFSSIVILVISRARLFKGKKVQGEYDIKVEQVTLYLPCTSSTLLYFLSTNQRMLVSLLIHSLSTLKCEPIVVLEKRKPHTHSFFDAQSFFI